MQQSYSCLFFPPEHNTWLAISFAGPVREDLDEPIRIDDELALDLAGIDQLCRLPGLFDFCFFGGSFLLFLLLLLMFIFVVVVRFTTVHIQLCCCQI